MHCEVCNKGLKDGLALFRINAKGVPGRWACTEHFKHFDVLPIDPEVLKVIDIVQGKKEK